MLKKLLRFMTFLPMLLGSYTLMAVSFFEIDPCEVRRLINNKIMNVEAETPEVRCVEELTISAAEYVTPLRIYTPDGQGSFPLILFIHGGAWVAGNLDTHDNLARYFCKHADAVVVSVGYKNSPEGKFPIPLEQCYNALLWAKANAKKLQIDDRVAMVGDSAGGNMAAALCLIGRDRDGPQIDYQVLINPAPDLTCGGTLEQQGDVLDSLRWQALMYLNQSEEIYHSYVSPLHADNLTGLPPAMILLAEFDDLRLDGELYALKLQAAGVSTHTYCQLGVNHLAGHGARASKEAQVSLDVAVAALREAFYKQRMP